MSNFFYLNSPLEQFQITPLINFLIIFITNSTFIFIFLALYLYIFIFILNKFIPTVFQQIFEVIYNVIIDLSYSNIGKNCKNYIPLIFSVFVFLLCCNLIGIIPYSFTITSHLAITFSLALTLYLGYNFIGIKKHKLKFLNLLLPSGASIFLVPLLVPIELISYIFRVISLPVRLFANMMAGHTLLKVIAGFAWKMLNGGLILFLSHFFILILLILLIGLELGVGIIQAFVFTILTCMYINDALNLH